MRFLQVQRILLVLPSEDVGGTELHTAGLAHALQQNGMEAILACDPAVSGRLQPFFPDLKFHEASVSWAARNGAAAAREAQAAEVASLLETTRPDAVVLALPWPNFGLGALQAVARAGLPLMVVSHLAPASGWLSGIDDMPWPLTQAGLVWIAVSEPVARRTEQLFDMPPGMLRVIPNGVDVPRAPSPAEEAQARAALRAELGVAPETPVALFAGRLEEAKGADRLPEIAAAFQVACGGVVACAGRGSWRRQLSTLAKGPLHVLGYRQDVDRLLLGSDALLLPSRIEGLPLIYLEAAARRRPVVASRAALACFGPFADERALVVADDDLPGFAQALEQAVQPMQVQAIVEEAFQQAVTHDRAAMHEAYISALRGLCALRAPSLA
ncbi:glycosyltransferase family 4 protein [Roseomonas sp. ACRSG]|nr:glycosyltransferase family 4 protein [Roseomonas sp. ACRSG]